MAKIRMRLLPVVSGSREPYRVDTIDPVWTMRWVSKWFWLLVSRLLNLCSFSHPSLCCNYSCRHHNDSTGRKVPSARWHNVSSRWYWWSWNLCGGKATSNYIRKAAAEYEIETYNVLEASYAVQFDSTRPCSNHSQYRESGKWWTDSSDGAKRVMLGLINKRLLSKSRRRIRQVYMKASTSGPNKHHPAWLNQPQFMIIQTNYRSTNWFLRARFSIASKMKMKNVEKDDCKMWCSRKWCMETIKVL